MNTIDFTLKFKFIEELDDSFWFITYKGFHFVSLLNKQIKCDFFNVIIPANEYRLYSTDVIYYRRKNKNNEILYAKEITYKINLPKKLDKVFYIIDYDIYYVLLDLEDRQDFISEHKFTERNIDNIIKDRS